MGSYLSVENFTQGEIPVDVPNYNSDHPPTPKIPFCGPSFPEIKPKKIYKTNALVNLNKSSVSLKKVSEDSDKYAISFTCDFQVSGTVQIYALCQETIDDNSVTEKIQLISTDPDVQRTVGIPISVEAGKNIIIQGTEENGGIIHLEDVKYQTVDTIRNIWHFIVFLHGNDINSGVYEQYSYFQVLTKNSIEAKLITQKVTLYEREAEQLKVSSFFISEIYGLKDLNSESECVVCLTNEKDTCILPCRHVCLCHSCANTLRLQSEKCPICRTYISELIYLSVTPSLEETKNGQTNIELKTVE
ncbi:hypothetical protein WA158_000395 [Blastocystis sp. Blastoise]